MSIPDTTVQTLNSSFFTKVYEGAAHYLSSFQNSVITYGKAFAELPAIQKITQTASSCFTKVCKYYPDSLKFNVSWSSMLLGAFLVVTVSFVVGHFLGPDKNAENV